MSEKITSMPIPDSDSPYTPHWIPSQFVGIKEAAARKNKELVDLSLGETIANAVSGGIGAVLSIAALVILVVVAALHGNSVRLLVSLVFGVPLLLSFLMSTLFHALPGDTPKLVFRVLGHDFLFLVIAGAFTPYCVLTLGGSAEAQIALAVIWAGAFLGILIESVWLQRPVWLPAVFCAGLCLVGLTLFPTLYEVLPAAGWWLVVASTICFSIGFVLLQLRKVPYLLFVAHLVALAGAICLFLSVVLFVI